MNKIENTIVFIALWVFSHFIVNSTLSATRTYRGSTAIEYIYSLAMAILIVFVWNKLFKKSE